MEEPKKRPVFVVGCHRSGTSFLYHCLLSAGGFAVYRSDTAVWDRLVPLCGDLRRRRNREKLLKIWLRSKPFRRTGLDAAQLERKILEDCSNGGEFLKVVMEQMAQDQNVDRWAAWDPDNTFYMREIKREIPDALFIHIIRDGRDIATVLDKKGWIKPFPWDRGKSLMVAGVFWEWMVRTGREYGQAMPLDYIEVRYEDLVTRPHETFAKLGAFIKHDLDYDRIVRMGVGVVTDPNSTFKKEFERGQFNPVGRWRERLRPGEIRALERVSGELLEELGYPLAAVSNYGKGHPSYSRILRKIYLAYFKSKQWLKSNTPLGRFVSVDPLELREQPQWNVPVADESGSTQNSA
jgi:Sulfotransferase family